MHPGRLFLRIVAALLLLGLSAGWIWAAPQEHGGKASGPQIFTPVRIDLGIWTLVVFGSLLFILKKYAWGPMLEGLHKREDRILAALEEASRAREEAQRLRADLQREMNNASDKVREILEEARRDAQHTRDEMIAAARAEIQTERDRLHREIETARDQALQQIWNQTAQLASLISTKVVRRELTMDDHRRLVDEALTELGQANVGWKGRTLY